jgi:hypothetical protein
MGGGTRNNLTLDFTMGLWEIQRPGYFVSESPEAAPGGVNVFSYFRPVPGSRAPEFAHIPMQQTLAQSQPSASWRLRRIINLTL